MGFKVPNCFIVHGPHFYYGTTKRRLTFIVPKKSEANYAQNDLCHDLALTLMITEHHCLN